jgi:hypothetical protein
LTCALDTDIFVPPEQVIDTVAIFYDPSRHRRLSLRFLSWFLLKQDIQTAEHDSIEDARCALQLYNKYRTFVQENRFADVLEDIYEAGQRLVSTMVTNWWAISAHPKHIWLGQGFKPPQATDTNGNNETASTSNNSLPATPEKMQVRRIARHQLDSSSSRTSMGSPAKNQRYSDRSGR